MISYSVGLMLFGLVAFSTCVPIGRSNRHNIYDCLGSATGKALYRGRHSNGGFPTPIATEIIFVPQPGSAMADTIRCISVLDQVRNGRGGYPIIASGGIGQNFVQIELTSQLFSKYDFIIEIYSD